MGRKAEHAVFDHGLVSYFLIGFCVMAVTSMCGLITAIILRIIIPGFDTNAASGVGAAISSLAIALAFRLYFAKEGYKGILNGNRFFWSFLMMLPFLVVHYTGSIMSWREFGFSGKILIALLTALTPGFVEEMAFRGLGVANFMRTAKSGKDIKLIFWLSSVVFGLVHIMNINAGGAVIASLIQSVYAIGVGMLFCAVYLRSGNLLPTIIAHMSVDFMEFLRGDLEASGGTMTGIGTGDWVTIGASAVAVVISLILMNKKHEGEIMALWNKKWGQ